MFAFYLPLEILDFAGDADSFTIWTSKGFLYF